MASNTVQNLKRSDHQFVDPPPDDLVCLICLSVARDPQQVNCCGKVLCRTCLQEHKRYSNICPQCRVDITSFSDKRSKSNTTAICCMILKDIDIHYFIIMISHTYMLH